MSFSLSEYTKIDVDVGWGFAPDPLDSLAGFKGPLCGRRGTEGRWGRGTGEGRGNRMIIVLLCGFW